MQELQALLDAYHWLRQYGINDSHSGNASCRVDDSIWVTPTGACADTLKVDDFIQSPLHGDITGGSSLDGKLHQMVYQKNDAARAVLHSHGPYSLAMTMNGEDFIPPDFEGHFYFQQIPVIDIPYDNYFEVAEQLISDALAEHRIVVARGHGIYACAETINLAYKWTCSFEQSAKTAYIAKTAGVMD